MTRSDPIRRHPLRVRVAAALGLAGATILITLGARAIVAAHQLTGRFTSPIPLGAYRAGAALAVAASFALVVAGRGPAAESASRGGCTVRVPPVLRHGLAAVGLLAWTWIVVRSVILDGLSRGDVGSLFLWTYGWVGLALVSAFIGP